MQVLHLCILYKFFIVTVLIFVLDEREAAFLEGVTKDDVINFYNKYVKVDAPNRAKLAVYVLGKDINSCMYSDVD